jgi:prephenate dehydrogenase
MLKNKTIAIVGLGFMGGSLGLAIRQSIKGVRVIGVSRSKSKIAQAKRLKMIHGGTTNLKQGVSEADWIILSTPVDHILKILPSVDKAAKKGAIVTDVGSVKTAILKRASRRDIKNIQFVGSHPLVGGHETGLKPCRRDLYKGGVVIVTSGSKSISSKAVQRFWKRLGMTVKVMTARRHDEVVAGISHLPHVISSLLSQSVNGNQIPFASSGFKDVTRLAQGDPNLWKAILDQNARPVLKEIKQFKKNLNQFEKLLSQKKSSKIQSLLKKAGQKRRRLK